MRVGTIGSIPYAFIGLERIGGIMMYEVSDPTDPTFVQYINTRSVDAEGEGDISLEGLIFIPQPFEAQICDEIQGSPDNGQPET